MSSSPSSPSSSSYYVTLCTPTEAAKLHQMLMAEGYTIDTPAFTRFRARKEGISCMIYLSGKVLIQGKNVTPFIATFFPSTSRNIPTASSHAAGTAGTQTTLNSNFRYTPGKLSPNKTSKPSPVIQAAIHKPCMGFDESGKGDVFGPLCLAGVYVGEEDAAQLMKWGVCDSKELLDNQILELATKIRLYYPYESLVLMPERYNALYLQFRNLNRLLAWGHVELMTALYEKTQCTHAVLDQFGSPQYVEGLLRSKQNNIALTQRTHAESSEIAVAAASILARAAFVEGMNALSKQFGFKLPKGAAHGIVQAGKRVLQHYGEEGLSKTVKLHFKTLLAIRA